jgi:hypothetical protein
MQTESELGSGVRSSVIVRWVMIFPFYYATCLEAKGSQQPGVLRSQYPRSTKRGQAECAHLVGFFLKSQLANCRFAKIAENFV